MQKMKQSIMNLAKNPTLYIKIEKKDRIKNDYRKL